MGDDNAAASANARGGLAGLGDFLYRLQVQRPLVQQETKEAAARTGALGAQTKAMELQNTLTESVTNPLAKRQFALQTLVLDPAKLPDSFEVPGEPIPAAPAAQAAPSASPRWDFKPAPAIKPPTVPGFTGASNTNVNGPGRSILSAPATPGDSTVPGTTAGATPSVPRETPNLGSGAGAPKAPEPIRLLSGDASMPAPALPAAEPAPQVQPPQSVPFDKRRLLSERFHELPENVQQALLRQGREQMAAKGFAVTDGELIRRYYENQQASYPPISPWSAPAGLVLKSIGPNGAEYLNPKLMESFGANGPQPFLMAPDGSVRDNPAYLKPADLIQRRGELATTRSAQKLLGMAKAVIQNNPDAYGQSLSEGFGGTVPGQIKARVKAVFGNPETYNAQRTLEMQNLKGMLETLGQVHIGRVTEMEWGALSGTMPHLTDDDKVWNEWLDRFNALLSEAQSALTDTLTPYGYGQLPPVKGGVGVTRPGSGSTAKSGSQVVEYESPEQAKKLRPGTLVRFPDGSIRPKL